jgi:hypothetical protein
VAATGLASAADASAQSLKVTGLTHSGNQITITVQNTKPRFPDLRSSP